MPQFILTLSSPDRTGVVAAVSKFIAEHSGSIGEAAHYATGDLDEGPIIEQRVHRVDHTKRPDDLADIGHDLEAVVLNNAVRWHAEQRVFVVGNRTVVLHS